MTKLQALNILNLKIRLNHNFSTEAISYKEWMNPTWYAGFCILLLQQVVSNGSPQLVKSAGKWLMYIHYNVLCKVIYIRSEIKLTSMRLLRTRSFLNSYFTVVRYKTKKHFAVLDCIATLPVTDNCKRSRKVHFYHPCRHLF